MYISKSEALEIHKKLESLSELARGSNELALPELTKVKFQFNSKLKNSYISEKFLDCTQYLEIWLSPRKWMKYPHLEEIINSSLYKFKLACDNLTEDGSDYFKRPEQ